MVMEVEMKGIEVTKLGALEKHLFMEKLITHIDNDNLRLLQKQRERTDRVGIKLPTIEVRFEHLSVEAECEVVHGKPLPTLWNSIQSFVSYFTKRLLCKSQDAHLSILKDVSGIIKPSRLTLLLGPPGCGKTTLLLALAGKLNKSLKVTGDVSYNGYKLNEFVPEKTSAYVSQYDLHMPEMTVRETLDFSARCQGVGRRPGKVKMFNLHPDTVTVEPGTISSLANVIQTENNFEFDHEEIMEEVSRREKEAGVLPDPDIDTYMKAISASGQKRNLQTDYVLKILGLDACADIMVGDGMRRGISGGQKKRLTTGEIVVGPIKTLFMDEISTGLDSSTTFQIVTCLQQMAHITDATVVVALLQPSPETFELFDDIILMAEGKILYHGPRSQVLQHFEDCGFKCPERKSVADFLQEVISEKDQAHLFCRTDHPHSYTTVSEFCDIFKSSVGEKFYEELSKPYDKSQSHKNALSLSTYSLSKWELFKACMDRELLLMKRNSFVYILKTAQLVIVALLTTTIFTRTRLSVNWLDANYYMGSLFYTLVRLMLNGIAELSLIVSRLPVFYKQQAVLLYPPWTYAIPAAIIKIPFSLLESTLWTSITYYVTGYSPEVERFFCQIFLLFAVHAASTSLLRSIAAIFQTMVAATAFGFFSLIFMFLFGGFITSRSSLPPWLRWGFWISPMAYGEIGLSVNEFLAPRWQKTLTGNTTLGQKILVTRGLNYDEYFYWISIGALVGYMVLFDLVFLWALTFFKAPEMSRAIISKAKLSEIQQREEGKRSAWDKYSLEAASPKTTAERRKLGSMALPFEPLAMVFKDVQYFVDSPPGMGKHQKKLQLLQDITGAFRPGVLTAIMGVSGAGKTTLMDVLSGRKTGGTIEGDISIGGYPKDQKTFARISGYCEQNDIHCPQLTVKESVAFSACLRLPPEVHAETKAKFVEEVLEIIELDEIKDSLVGIPGQSGLFTGQRKRLTIAVELVSNPSIIFMDEPTSGLDTREAAIVIRTVKNVVDTGRTSVCTIHQPSIDIFEAFDELILMKRGGQVIYSGNLGHHSIQLKEYFESITGLPKLKEKINPATWMLEITSASVEAELGLDFAKIYKESPQYQETLRLVRYLSEPPAGSKKLQFPTPFAQSSWGQYSACLWKQHLAYWRSPEYNLVRCMFLVITGMLFGAVFWQKGEKINNEQDLFNILGSMYAAVLFLGTNNCTLTMQYVSAQRNVMYREMFSGMYSSTAFSLAQVTIEIQYLLVQVLLYMAIVYPAMGYCWSAYKIFWFFYATLCTFLYFSYLGMLISSLSPNLHVGIILAGALYTVLNLFSGFLIPGPEIPDRFEWSYWMCPTSWSLNALLTSQYGDMDTEVMVFGEKKPVGTFLEQYYGYQPDRLGVAALALIAFPVIFASLFAYFTRKLNFQRR